MDLNSVTAVARPRGRAEIPAWRAGDAFLGGGTWLFSEPQPALRRLIDLAALGWPAIERRAAGLSLAATCTIAELYAFEPPPEWRAGWLIRACCDAFLASFKIWNTATVGGNLCLALPAGPMIALAVALEADCVVWRPDGTERVVAAADFVLGPERSALAPGEILRRIDISEAALRRRAAMRRASLTPHGRSAVLLIGTRGEAGDVALTVTAATVRPIGVFFGAFPAPEMLLSRLNTTIPDALYYDDVHGRPDWRRHMTRHLAAEMLPELAGPP